MRVTTARGVVDPSDQAGVTLVVEFDDDGLVGVFHVPEDALVIGRSVISADRRGRRVGVLVRVPPHAGEPSDGRGAAEGFEPEAAPAGAGPQAPVLRRADRHVHGTAATGAT
jgi:hypothetical protein